MVRFSKDYNKVMTVFLLTFIIILFLDMKLSAYFNAPLQQFLVSGLYKDHVIFPQLPQERKVIRTIKRLQIVNHAWHCNLHERKEVALQRPQNKDNSCKPYSLA